MTVIMNETSTQPAAPRTASRVDERTRVLLEGPIAPTLLRLAAPNVLVMLPAAVTAVGAAAMIPLSPSLIFGLGPFPHL
jgi:hypothetical protein